MLILQYIYKVFIGPLELLFEVLYSVALSFIGDPGWSIVILSLAMNFLVLPLYRRADAMQEEERDRAAAMKPWVDHIKKTFTGDERFMMLQTYYRQVGYKQTDALKGSLSLLLEIPFFIAAFHFLSNLQLLKGVPFGPIADLGAPDALIQLGGISINFLPILMTAINVVSAAIYMKGFPLKSKVQMYGIAAIFLVLLYASPAGLVFYWTLNNLFSLVKNIFYKLKDPKKVLAVLASVTGAVLLAVALFVHPLDTVKKQAFIIACALLLQLPLVLSFRKKRAERKKAGEAGSRKEGRFHVKPATPSDGATFLLGCLFLSLLAGLVIPLTVIQASPSEFVSVTMPKSPLWYLLDSFALAFGTFVIWFGVFYRLATPKGKSVFGFIVWAMAGAALVDSLAFGLNYGNLSVALVYDGTPTVSLATALLNFAVLTGLFLLLFVIWRKKRIVVRVVCISMCVAMVAMSAYNIMVVNDQIKEAQAVFEAAERQAPHFTLSKTGRNVVVIMMDRAVTQFVPYIMNENAVVKRQFEGFTWYPNAVSYGAFTNVGVPGLYGGYEYIPEKMNERSDTWLGDKQDEALRVMPGLFDESGYDVTVYDPTYGRYKIPYDTTVYADHPDIAAYHTMDGSVRLKDFETPTFNDYADVLLTRNFFCFSIFRMAPTALQPTLYDSGNYHEADTPLADVATSNEAGDEEKPVVIMPQSRDSVTKAVGVDEIFVNPFAVLESMSDMTKISEEGEGGFLMMSNDSVHNPIILKEPEYVPVPAVDNTEYDAEHPGRYAADGSYLDLSSEDYDIVTSPRMHYQVNMAAYQQLGAWFDYLRENGLYDNTRIIIVSDHGQHLGLDDRLSFVSKDGTNWDLQKFACLLMVKDFNSTEFKVDNQFMTNADVPTIAFGGVIDNPVNPATGNPIDSSAKQGEQHIMWSEEWDIGTNNGNTFLPGDWFSVHDNIYDTNNWDYLGYY